MLTVEHRVTQYVFLSSKYSMRLFELFESEFHPMPYYHGTSGTFDGVPNPSPSGVYGPGVYLSNKPLVAKAFAGRNVHLTGGTPVVKEYRIRGKLANDKLLTTALEQAREEGYARNAKYVRASEILAAQGFSGIEDGQTTVIFDPKDIIPIAS